jgi:integrase
MVDELALHLRAPGRPTDPAFRSPAGGLLRVTGFRQRIWRPATLAAGLPGLRIHDLRHGGRAVDRSRRLPKEVAVRAGHTSTSFLLDRYGHLFPEPDAALCDRLDVLLCRDGTGTEHGRLKTRTGRWNRVAPCALHCCDGGGGGEGI